MAAVYWFDLPIICLLVFSDTSSQIFFGQYLSVSAVLDQLPFAQHCVRCGYLTQASQSESSTPRPDHSDKAVLWASVIGSVGSPGPSLTNGSLSEFQTVWKKGLFCRNVSWDGGIWGTGGHSLPEKVVKKEEESRHEWWKEEVGGGGRDRSLGTLLESLYSALPKASLVLNEL